MTRARTGDVLAWAGSAVALFSACLCAISSFEEFPYWRLDPSVIRSDLAGMGPSAMMASVLLAMLGLTLVLAGRAIAGRRIWAIGLGGLGVVGAMVVYHGWVSPGSTIGHRFIGLMWLGSLVAGLALFEAGRQRGVRAMGLAVLIGAAAVMGGKAAIQLTIEHRSTVEYYRANREAILAANGWTDGSPSTLAYERRLLEPVPTGWFAMPNVFATVAGGAGIALLAGSIASLRQRGLSATPGTLGGIGAVLVGLAVLSGSKGAFAAIGLGAVATGAWVLVDPLRKLIRKRPVGSARVALAVVVLAPIAAVVARGLVGPALNELSLWFRWFYWTAAAKITAGRPLGVGPDGFQAAYSVTKSLMSPEEVRSSHNVFIDYFATLGVLGGACAALLILRWAWGAVLRATRAATSDETAGGAERMPALPDPSGGTVVRVGLLVAALATVAAAWLDREAVTPETAATRLVGLGMWGAIVVLVARWRGRDHWLDVAAGTGVVVMLAHTQIDVAATWLNSAMWFGAWFGLAGANRDEDTEAAPATGATPSTPPRASTAWAGAGVAAAATVALLLGVVMPTARWESRLHSSAERLWQVADLRSALLTVRADTLPETAWPVVNSVVMRLTSLLGRIVPAEPKAVWGAVDEVEQRALTQGVEELTSLPGAYGNDARTRQAVSRMLVNLAMETTVRSDPVRKRELLDRAVALSRVGAGTPRDAAPRRAWTANVLEARHHALGDPADVRAMAEELAAACGLAPGSTELAARAAVAFSDAGDAAAAARWAKRALELEELGRLDPVAQGLSDSRRERLRRLASEP